VSEKLIYTDEDGDVVVIGETYNGRQIFLTRSRGTGEEAEVYLTVESATAIRDALDEYITAETAPKYAVGDRVEIHGWSSYWDGPATVVDPVRLYDGAPYIYVKTDAGRTGAFDEPHVRPYTPDYAAIAATFKPGDLAIVGDNPSLHEKADGYGVRVDDFAGKTVTIVDEGHGNHTLYVQTLGGDDFQYIHVAHLTRAKAVAL
jgi:hypothetical protein